MTIETEAIKNIVVPIPSLTCYPDHDAYVYEFSCIKDALTFFQAKAADTELCHIKSLFLEAYTVPKKIKVIILQHK